MDEALLQQLRQSEDELLALKNAVDASQNGYWNWTEQAGMKWDNGMLELFSIKPDKAPATLEEFLMLLGEDSQEAAMDAFEDARAHNKQISVEITADKNRRRLRLTVGAFLMPGSPGPAMSGMCQQIESKSDDAAQAQSHSELANFASVASHDLREPLRMITSYLRLLKERSPDALDDRARRYIDYACEGGDRMRCLIEDLLSYARMEKESINPVPLALEDVLSETISNLSATIQETGADVTVDVDLAPIVMGDSINLVRLFQNLIGNGIKFHAEGETPRVQVSFEDGETKGSSGYWVVGIKDHGIGIEPDHHELLFTLFQRLNTRDEFEGSGIGLAVCRKIAERHKGSITLKSQKGKGSTFYVSLPKAPPDAIGARI